MTDCMTKRERAKELLNEVGEVAYRTNLNYTTMIFEDVFGIIDCRTGYFPHIYQADEYADILIHNTNDRVPNVVYINGVIKHSYHTEAFINDEEYVGEIRI